MLCTCISVEETLNAVVNISEIILTVKGLTKLVDEVVNISELIVQKITAVVAVIKKGLRTLDKLIRSLDKF